MGEDSKILRIFLDYFCPPRVLLLALGTIPPFVFGVGVYFAEACPATWQRRLTVHHRSGSFTVQGGLGEAAASPASRCRRVG